MSILTLQRRLTEVGRIRMGEKRTSDSGKTYPAKLSTWRLTSPDPQRLEEAAALYGGTVEPWEDQHQLVTESSALDIALLPERALTQFMEHWGQEKPRGPVVCLRRCDGQRELLTDNACLCTAESDDESQLLCKPTTHLMVLLRRVAGVGSWRLSTRGWYAAQELLGTAELLEQLTQRSGPVPARLRMDQRTVTRADGTKRFVVPVIDIDVALDDVMGAIGAAPAAAGELPAARFRSVPVQELAPGPQQSIAEQAAAVGEEPPRRKNGQVPIPATGVRPRTAQEAGATEVAEPPGDDGPRLSGAQLIAMRLSDRGVTDRAQRLAIVGAMVGRSIESSKDLTAKETRAVLDALKNEAFELPQVEDPGSGDVGTEPDSGAGEGEEASGQPPSSPPSPPPPTPSSPATPGTGDEGTWDGDRWRAYVKEKGVTVTEALKQAQELAREMDSKVPTRLDEIAGNETLAGLLRGFIDEVALERGR